MKNGQLWWHATATPFDVESQIAQRLFCTVFWLYSPILRVQFDAAPDAGQGIEKPD